MSITKAPDVKLALPAEFHSLPALGDSTGLAELVASLSLPDESAARLSAALGAARSSVGLVPAWALVREPELGYLDAILTLSVHEVSAEDSPRQYLENAAFTVTSNVVNRRAELRVTAGLPSAVLHDFMVPAGSDKPALERAYAAVFLGSGAMLEFGVLTQDLHLFDDSLFWLCEILDGGLEVDRVE